MAGRQTKLTPEIQTAICTAVTVGVPYVQAAVLAGVGPSTALEWIQRGEGRHARRATTPYAEFAEALARAKAQDMARRVARINQAGQGGAALYEKVIETLDEDGRVTKRVSDIRRAPPDWRADAWHLERAYPKEFGDRQVLALKWQQEAEAMVEEEIQEMAKEFGLDPAQIRQEVEESMRRRAQRRAWHRNGHGG